jgi:hypothetical protein
VVEAHRIFIGVGVALIVAGSAVSFGTPTKAKAAPPAVTFGVPTLADAVHTYGEPDINFGIGDRTFVSGPTGTGTQRSMWNASFDQQAYRLVNQNAAVGPMPSASINDPPGGGDTEIVFDNGALAGHPNQGMYFSDLFALLCFRVEASHDYGATNTQNTAPTTAGCAGQQPTADRQWQTVFDPPTGVTSTSAYALAGGIKPLIYLTYNGGGALWNRSTDGTTYVPADGGGTTTFNPHWGNDGYPAIDQVTGKVFEAAGDGAGKIFMNIGTPLVNGDLCFLDDTATSHPPCPAGAGLITAASGLTGDPNAHFPVLTIDQKRNLYLSWNQLGNSSPLQDQVFVTATPARGPGELTDKWDTWTTPVQVSDGLASTGDVVNSFSWSASGGNQGIADVAWYGSNKTDDPNVNNCGVNLAAPACEIWNTFFNQVQFQTDASGAISGPPTTIPTPMIAAQHPMHYGDICGAGTGCITQQGNRNLADFFMVRTDSTGAVEIVYNDTSNGLLMPGGPSNNQTADHAGAPVVTVVRQNSGRGVLGTPVTLTPTNYPAGVTAPTVTPIDHLDGAPNNALYSTTSGAIAGSNFPGMDLTRTQLSLSGSTLTVTMKVSNLADATVATGIPGTTLQQYVTRWVMATPGDPLHPFTIFYAGMTCTPGSCSSGGSALFYAGAGQTMDLCSVSACFPHVLLYPEEASMTPVPPLTNGATETGSVSCSTTPCTVTINVNTANIGNPTASSLLMEVGAYSFASSHPQVATTVAQAQLDNVQLMIDGVCCYNFGPAGPSNGIPESLWAPVLLPVGAAVAAVGVLIGRRRRSRATQ